MFSTCSSYLGNKCTDTTPISDASAGRGVWSSERARAPVVMPPTRPCFKSPWSWMKKPPSMHPSVVTPTSGPPSLSLRLFLRRNSGICDPSSVGFPAAISPTDRHHPDLSRGSPTNRNPCITNYLDINLVRKRDLSTSNDTGIKDLTLGPTSLGWKITKKPR
ncbi:hypothetical protein LZ30DRAFT_77977 [Colletotrichum cereale]|nr:hypothetical protein LZ30DRAFT_77977 [Colletotrichum cereale]